MERICLLFYRLKKKQQHRTAYHTQNIFFDIGLSKQQALDADPKAVQQFSWKCWASRKYSIVFILEEVKGTILNFLQGTMRVLKIYFDLI